ncbi:MAG: nucleotide exchange factor GrpE [Myxococcales bacterium]
MNDAEQKPGVDEASAANSGAANGAPETESAASGAEPSTEDLLRLELEKAKEEAARLKDQLLRTAADFDNFRKRARKDVEDAQKKGLERALLEMLPVSDNLQRAIQAAGHTKEVGAIVEGVRMVLKMTEDALERLGVERVESVGQPFDPGLHEAVQQLESDQPAGTVVHEMVPGFRLGGKLLRAAMVAVAKPKAAESAKN